MISTAATACDVLALLVMMRNASLVKDMHAGIALATGFALKSIVSLVVTRFADSAVSGLVVKAVGSDVILIATRATRSALDLGMEVLMLVGLAVLTIFFAIVETDFAFGIRASVRTVLGMRSFVVAVISFIAHLAFPGATLIVSVLETTLAQAVSIRVPLHPRLMFLTLGAKRAGFHRKSANFTLSFLRFFVRNAFRSNFFLLLMVFVRHFATKIRLKVGVG